MISKKKNENRYNVLLLFILYSQTCLAPQRDTGFGIHFTLHYVSVFKGEGDNKN